jgi:hypothetical protein
MMRNDDHHGNDLSAGVRHLHCRYCEELGYHAVAPLLPVSDIDDICSFLEGRCPLTHDVVESWLESTDPPAEYHNALKDVHHVVIPPDVPGKPKTHNIVKHLKHLVDSQVRDPDFKGETKISAINYKSAGLKTVQDVIVKICMKYLHIKENIFQVCKIICQEVTGTPWMLIEWYFDPRLDSVHRSAFAFDLARKFDLRGPEYASELFYINAAGLFPLNFSIDG